MANRAYGQFCGFARALEAVGERWALLIVRDLMVGPKRFTDLRRGFQGPSTLVETVQEQAPFSGHIVSFRGNRGHLVKLL